MAYTMTHILIAEKVLGFFDCPIDYATYIVGAIAPDAVHANPNYSPELKEKSHLFADGLKWGEVASEKEYSKDKLLVDTLKKGRSYSIPNIYDDSIFENRITQLFDFEFKKWDIDTIEKNSICTIENTIALIEKAPTVIKKIFIDDFYHR